MLGSATERAASPAVEMTFAVEWRRSPASRPGVNGPKAAGVPSVSDSVAATVPPTPVGRRDDGRDVGVGDVEEHVADGLDLDRAPAAATFGQAPV